MKISESVIAERVEEFRSGLIRFTKEAEATQEALEALCRLTSQDDETELACLATDAIWTDGVLKNELRYVLEHDRFVNADVQTRVKNILDPFSKHLTRQIFRKYGRTVPKELTHFVGQFGDGYGCGVFYRSRSNGEVHARCVWEEDLGLKVDETFEAVIPNGEGGWKRYFPSVALSQPDASEDNPDVFYNAQKRTPILQ